MAVYRLGAVHTTIRYVTARYGGAPALFESVRHLPIVFSVESRGGSGRSPHVLSQAERAEDAARLAAGEG